MYHSPASYGHPAARPFLTLSRPSVLVALAALAVSAISRPAEAQKISVEATKRTIELANDLYLLDPRLLTEAAARKVVYKREESKAILMEAVAEVNRQIALLRDGEAETGMDREQGVAI